MPGGSPPVPGLLSLCAPWSPLVHPLLPRPTAVGSRTAVPGCSVIRSSRCHRGRRRGGRSHRGRRPGGRWHRGRRPGGGGGVAVRDLLDGGLAEGRRLSGMRSRLSCPTAGGPRPASFGRAVSGCDSLADAASPRPAHLRHSRRRPARRTRPGAGGAARLSPGSTRRDGRTSRITSSHCWTTMSGAVLIGGMPWPTTRTSRS
jgi:hypothetical protein